MFPNFGAYLEGDMLWDEDVHSQVTNRTAEGRSLGTEAQCSRTLHATRTDR